MAKGGSYEREIGRRLSLWWSNGENDDLFWRTSGSGARATVRGRKGLRTTNHCGDICNTDSIGEPLIKVITFELKRGYSRSTIADLLDCSKESKQQVYEGWFEKAENSRKNAGSFAWVLIHKRDRREPLIFMPNKLWVDLVYVGDGLLFPMFSFIGKLRRKDDHSIKIETVVCMRLEDFLSRVKPQHILEIYKKMEGADVTTESCNLRLSGPEHED